VGPGAAFSLCVGFGRVLKPRIIPVLLMDDGALYKTRRFADPVYVGDPINAVRIFNEKEVDELMVIDIAATAKGREPDYALIADLAAECRMPMGYGGGVTRPDQVDRITSLGVEKVAFSAAAIANPELVAEAAASVGAQSVVVVLDVRRSAEDWEIYTHNGTRRTGRRLADVAREMVLRGAGEIVVNDIERDGEMAGYDLDLARNARHAVASPLTLLGGAGKREHVADLFRAVGIVGAAAGSMFVFKGSLRAVLITYPNRQQKDLLGQAALLQD
jgi:cyclase